MGNDEILNIPGLEKHIVSSNADNNCICSFSLFHMTETEDHFTFGRKKTFDPIKHSLTRATTWLKLNLNWKKYVKTSNKHVIDLSGRRVNINLKNPNKVNQVGRKLKQEHSLLHHCQVPNQIRNFFSWTPCSARGRELCRSQGRPVLPATLAPTLASRSVLRVWVCLRRRGR